MSGKKTTFVYLNEKDMLKAGVLDGRQCVETIDEMFRLVGEGDYLMGGLSENEHGQRLYFPVKRRFPNMPVAGPDRRFMAMIAYLGGGFNVCAAKWYGSNIENPGRGLPRSVLIVVLNDVETGEPLALMSANLLSAMRTGAVPAVAARHLARNEAKTVACIGAGLISRATMICMKAALPQLKEGVVYDIVTERAEPFCTRVNAETGLSMWAAVSIEEAVRSADVLTIATSGSTPPLLKEEWVKPGAFIASQATAGIPDKLLVSSRVVFDEIKTHQLWKEEEEKIPEEEAAKRLGFPGAEVFRLCEEGKMDPAALASLGEIVCGKKAGRTTADERFILIVGGLPVEDAAWGHAVYQNARRMGIGQELVLWDEPHWM